MKPWYRTSRKFVMASVAWRFGFNGVLRSGVGVWTLAGTTGGTTGVNESRSSGLSKNETPYWALPEVTAVGGGFSKGLVLGVVKTVGTWGLLTCVKSGSASDCQLGPGTACKVEAIRYWGRENNTLLSHLDVLTTIALFEIGKFCEVAGSEERVAKILLDTTRGLD